MGSGSRGPTTAHRGVHLDPSRRTRPWVAEIYRGGRRIRKARFATEAEAVAAAARFAAEAPPITRTYRGRRTASGAGRSGEGLHDYSALFASGAKLWSHVVRGAANHCWPWSSGKRLRRGYGAHVSYEDGRLRVIGAHRAAWALANGRLPDPALYVCHRCDNPPCCNPAHLFLGTGIDNMRDARNKGRVRNGTASLSWEDVLGVRALAGKHSYELLTARYGVKRHQIRRIANGQRWSGPLAVPPWTHADG